MSHPLERDVVELRQRLANAEAWVDHERRTRQEGRRLWLLLITPLVVAVTVIVTFHATQAAASACIGSVGLERSACHVNIFTVVPWWIANR